MLLEVIDHGPGVPADLKERIFEPFAAARTTGHPASGSGLAVAKGFAEAMGGDDRRRSTPPAAGSPSGSPMPVASPATYRAALGADP